MSINKNLETYKLPAAWMIGRPVEIGVYAPDDENGNAEVRGYRGGILRGWVESKQPDGQGGNEDAVFFIFQTFHESDNGMIVCNKAQGQTFIISVLEEN